MRRVLLGVMVALAMGGPAWAGGGALQPLPPPDAPPPAVTEAPVEAAKPVPTVTPTSTPAPAPTPAPTPTGAPASPSPTPSRTGFGIWRPLALTVNAWAYHRGHRDVYVRRIDITEVENPTNHVGYIYGHTFASESLSLRTARQYRNYSVVVRWMDGREYRTHYRLTQDRSHTLTIYQPGW